MTTEDKKYILDNNRFDKCLRPTQTKEEKKQYYKEYYVKNKEVITKRSSQYRIDNADKIKKTNIMIRL